MNAYGELGNATNAASVANVDVSNHYRRLREDLHGYKAKFELARNKYADLHEQWIRERLTHPQGNKGSDLLLIFSTKAARPEKYRDAVPLADDYGKEVVAELRKSRKQDREIERLRAQVARLQEGESR